jgi:ferric-dicitrate binding protein FerR (iron transport regulator)
MKTEEPDIIYEILPRYCNGAATREESKRVEKWIEQSEENYKIVQQIHLIYLTADTMNVLTKIDVDKALAKVRQQMTVKRKSTVFVWLQRIAAILFIPLVIALLSEYIHKDSELPVSQLIEVKTNPGMTTSITLPDGSLVRLNSESSLRYPSVFSGNDRQVFLQGEGFFSVVKNDRKRFIVSTPHDAHIEVVGTKFNVEAFGKDSLISTTLVEGHVNFLYTDDDAQKTVALLPEQKLVYNSLTSNIKLYYTTGEIETAWKDGKIVFNNTPLAEALRMLGKRYNVEFVIANDKLKKDSFTGNFTHERLERILQIFKISSNINWRYSNAGNATDEKTEIEIY